MLKIVVILLFFVFSLVNAADTLIVQTRKVKGFGPFRHGVHPLKELSEDNPWFNCSPQIKGIPDTLKNSILVFEETDFFQYAYQCFKNNKVDAEEFFSLKKLMGKDSAMAFLCPDEIKVVVPIVAGLDSQNRVVVIADRNNNYDLSDDQPYRIPPKLPGQIYWGRYHDLLPFEIKYEYFDGETVKHGHTWLYVDYDFSVYNLPDSLFLQGPVQIADNFAEHRVGTFTLNGQKYQLAIYNNRPVYRHSTLLKVKKITNNVVNEKYSNEIQVGEKIRIGNTFYRFEKVLNAGQYVMLIKVSQIAAQFGSEVGSRALPFSARSIEGQEIDLKKLIGNYILLDFWGTWCRPCVAEIPNLKAIFKKYGGQNFKLIGIANDMRTKLIPFLKENHIHWPQILQEKSKEIINLYQVQSYPTTILIDPRGKIIAKNLRGKQLQQKLEELFKK